MTMINSKKLNQIKEIPRTETIKLNSSATVLIIFSILHTGSKQPQFVRWYLTLKNIWLRRFLILDETLISIKAESSEARSFINNFV